MWIHQSTFFSAEGGEGEVIDNILLQLVFILKPDFFEGDEKGWMFCFNNYFEARLQISESETRF